MTAERSDALLAPLFGVAEVDAMFDDAARLQRMLDFEAALARAEERVGVIPAGSASAIAACCWADRFDLAALGEGVARAGNPAVPMVQALTALVAQDDPDAARYVHWGATSQDAMDTGLALQQRDGLAWIAARLAELSAALAALAAAHKRTPMAGRTWLQQGPPVSFGLKAAGWLSAVERQRARLRGVARRSAVLQFGGAVGTLAALGDRGLDVAMALAEQLDLALPELPWHAQRDRPAEVATALALLVGTLGKMAGDVVLLAQTEVAEVHEGGGAGRGGSSTMPHKRNPVACAAILAAATRAPALAATVVAAMPQAHERGLGDWHAEWETIPELFRLAGGAVAHAVEMVAGLQVDPARMRRNIELSRGLIFAEAVAFALAAHVGREAAHHLLAEACRAARDGDRHLRDVLADDPRVSQHLGGGNLDRLFDPDAYLGQSERFVDRVLAGLSGVEPDG